MTEHPIIMGTWSMQRILAGAKTQTRRLISPQPTFHFDRPQWQWVWTYPRSKTTISTSLPPSIEAWCAPWQPGDLLWVREGLVKCRHTGIVVYEEDHCSPARRNGHTVIWPWKRDRLPSIFCPRWASRLTLRVKSLRAELIQDISHEDCLAEGLYGLGAKLRFFVVWYRLYAKRVGTRDNPWIWVTEFERAHND